MILASPLVSSNINQIFESSPISCSNIHKPLHSFMNLKSCFRLLHSRRLCKIRSIKLLKMLRILASFWDMVNYVINNACMSYCLKGHLANSCARYLLLSRASYRNEFQCFGTELWNDPNPFPEHKKITEIAERCSETASLVLVNIYFLNAICSK